LFEIDPDLSLTTYLERCHQFCFHCRTIDNIASESDRQRESFMVAQIRAALAAYHEPILVVTGGFHSYALYAQVFNIPFVEALPVAETVQQFIQQQVGLNLPVPATKIEQRGIALTPFTYERLDSLTGYNAGMPSPGFYDQVWHHRQAAADHTPIHRQLLAQVTRSLRQRKQQFSVADLIAVEVTAQGLASLRGHSQVWRQDILDGIRAALIKEEVRLDENNPFLAAVLQIFRGSARGCLASGTSLPPLVRDIQQQLQTHHLEPQSQAQLIHLDLTQDLPRSHILHQLRVLAIAGFQQTKGTDFAIRADLSHFWAEWTIAWSPAYEGSCIEAALYGATLREAAAARILERVTLHSAGQAEAAALALLDTCLMGLHPLAPDLAFRVSIGLRGEDDFFSATAALSHLLYLYRYDEVLGTAKNSDVGQLLKEAFVRSLWLLESLGQISDRSQALLAGIATILETFRGCHQALELNREAFVDIFQRISRDAQQTPLLRGATMGALWLLGETPIEQISGDMQYLRSSDSLGDFLTGLFSVAREIVQRQPQVLLQLDQLLLSFDDEMFLVALPALRLAFTFFTPREKHILAQTLVRSWAEPDPDQDELIQLTVAPEVIARAMALETKLWQTLERYHLRGRQAQ
jgi:hypothetical protein